MRALVLAFFVFTIGFAATQAQAAQETEFVITVKARDAKFIGTAAGGAQITVRDRRSGDIIAHGITFGGTGDTETIMADSLARDAVLVSEDSAKLQFALELWEPVPVTITATAPLGQAQSTVSVTEETVLIPGKDYASGNGILIELPGFAVDVTSPHPAHKFPLNPDVPFTVEANVMKLCGCLVAEDTPWSPERYEVEAHVYKDNLFITSAEMNYSGEPGVYVLDVKVPLPGTYRVIVTAFDPVTKESGMDSTTIIMEEKKS